MRCFRHRDCEAIAICQGCGRALCDPCVVPQQGLSAVCSGTCSRRVEFTRSALGVLYRNVQKSNRVGALFLLTAGAALGAVAFFAGLAAVRTPSPRPANVVGFLVAALASVFVTGYGVLLWRAQEGALQDDADQEPSRTGPHP
jgi:hypothetical protein